MQFKTLKFFLQRLLFLQYFFYFKLERLNVLALLSMFSVGISYLLLKFLQLFLQSLLLTDQFFLLSQLTFSHLELSLQIDNSLRSFLHCWGRDLPFAQRLCKCSFGWLSLLSWYRPFSFNFFASRWLSWIEQFDSEFLCGCWVLWP